MNAPVALLHPDTSVALALEQALHTGGFRVAVRTHAPHMLAAHPMLGRCSVLVHAISDPQSFSTHHQALLRTAPLLVTVLLVTPQLRLDSSMLGALLYERNVVAVVSELSPTERILKAVDNAHHPGAFVDQTVLVMVRSGDPPRRAELSRMERSVIQHLQHGKRLREIAVLLGLSESTVKSHGAKAAAKLGCSSSLEAARRAASLGLIDDGAAPPPTEAFVASTDSRS